MDNDFLPNNGDLPVIRAVYEGVEQSIRAGNFIRLLSAPCFGINEKVVSVGKRRKFDCLR